MWNLLSKTKEKCTVLRDSLEETAAHSGSLAEWTKHLPPEHGAHLAECPECQQAGRNFFATRAIFQGAASRAEDGGPWFAARVMRAIAARSDSAFCTRSLSSW